MLGRWTLLPHAACRVGGRHAGSATLARRMSVRALVVSKADKKGPTKSEVTEFESVSNLPQQAEGNVVVSVEYSTLNYKDGLALTGAPGVVLKYPIVPGMVESRGERFKEGDRVVLTGNYCGQHVDGGYATHVTVNDDWLVPLPPSFSSREAMVIGTAGFTSMQCIHHLMSAGNLKLGESGEVLVTGAAGGVGSVAVAILANMGFNVTASTGRVDEAGPFLKELGANQIIGRLEAGRPMERERWAAVVDTVGGEVLAAAIAATRYTGAVAACGVAGGPAVATTVFPFILRGVRLLGVDSVQAPMAERELVWNLLEENMPRSALEAVAVESVGLEELPALGKSILAGQVKGRVVVDPRK